ncbi:CBS domain-containing protein [Nonomuraea sp. NPDC049649]|uniref:CBS domain-containing protein n=1 Tax=Nonomuraea sp. NPDC049649 TaxID=3155776 RepID=UPI003445E3A6
MDIANVYRPMVFGCQADEKLPDVARRMTEKNVGALAVLDDGQITGLITERDIVRALATAEDPASVRAGEYASTYMRVAALHEDTHEVARRMLDYGIRHMPVDEGGRVVGMVSMRDLLAVEAWMS